MNYRVLNNNGDILLNLEYGLRVKPKEKYFYEIARVKREQFQNFQKSQGWFIPKITRTKHVVSG